MFTLFKTRIFIVLSSVFYSNRVEFLYEELKKKLFVLGDPFAKRLIVVPSAAMKSWLMLQLANDPEVGIASGLKILDLDRALTCEGLPSSMELSLGIEEEIRSSLDRYQPIFEFLEIEESGISSRANRRMTALSKELAYLFQRYGKYGEKMLKNWKQQTNDDWQQELWKEVYQKRHWKILYENLQTNLPEIHLFCISHFCRLYHEFLIHHKAHYYILSPCQFFWSDLSRSEHYGNALLANFGKLGRQTAFQLEESQIETFEKYGVPEASLHFPQYNEALTGEETIENADEPLTLLRGIQTDMLVMREKSLIALQEDDSLQIHQASTLLREVQILHDQLLSLCHLKNLKPGDICVMAPDIKDYEPYIQMVFNNGPFRFQINDGISQVSIVKIFMFFLRLPFGRWDAPSLLKLFEHQNFRKKQGLTEDDLSLIRFWIKEARINWGADVNHRNELLNQKISDENPAGTWENGFQRLIYGLAMEHDKDLSPLPCVDPTEMELLGKWMFLMRSLKEDLSLFTREEKSLAEWVEVLEAYLIKYFSQDEDETLKEQFRQLRSYSGEGKFPFSTVLNHLEENCEKRSGPFREHDLNAVCFNSFLPMRTIPSKVIALIGLSEGDFPRKERRHPLDRLGNHEDYIPSQVDYDRYLFLEALLSARQHLLISYQTDGGQNLPSLLISELLHYCDEHYLIDGKKPLKSW